MRDAARHPVIEAFLSGVDERLRRLPAARRAAERDELAQHLDLLVTAYRARGMDEDAAARAAVVRFGRAERIGADLRGAWQHEHDDTFGWPRFLAGYGALIVPYLGVSWFHGAPIGWDVAFGFGIWLLMPALFYADRYKQRRTAERIGHRA